MISPSEIILAVKPFGQSKDIRITIEDLCKIFSNVPRYELVHALSRMDRIQVGNSSEGGLIIPKYYFE